MSTENLKTVRHAIEAFNRREVPLEQLDPQVEWVEDPRYPDAQTYHGHAGVERSLAKWWEAWASVTMKEEGSEDDGDRVAMWGHIGARGRDPEVTVNAPFGPPAVSVRGAALPS